MIVERSHDSFYLQTNRRKKEYFKVLYRLIKNHIEDKFGELLDIGCATGDFLFFAKEELPNLELYGLEIMPALAKKIDFGPKVFLGNIADQKTLPKKKFDIITMLGVHGIFDDFHPIFENIFSLMKENSVLYIFGIFNPEDIDVLIKSRSSSKEPLSNSKFETGWNCFSKKSIQLFFEEKGYSSEFIPFQLGIEIQKNEADPLRSWTEGNINNFFVVKNGLQLIHNFYFCKIAKKK